MGNESGVPVKPMRVCSTERWDEALCTDKQCLSQRVTCSLSHRQNREAVGAHFTTRT